jgi:RNA polymerase sigma-54 factor
LVDFGSYFQDYLDPGYKTATTFEDYDKPSFEHFLSAPSTLTDHLLWQLGSMTLSPQKKAAAELVIGNLTEDGYLAASDEELAQALLDLKPPVYIEPIPFERGLRHAPLSPPDGEAHAAPTDTAAPHIPPGNARLPDALHVVTSARELVHQLDPVGVGARDLRECLLIQIDTRRREAEDLDGDLGEAATVFETASFIIRNCLALLQKKDMRELTRSCAKPAEHVNEAVELIRHLDPKPGRRYNRSETQLIEPDVAFVKRGDDWVVVVNEEDLPTLRLNREYRRMLRQKDTDKEVKDYVKERFRSAIQLLRNIEQRKSTIVRTCEVIVRRQGDFL